MEQIVDTCIWIDSFRRKTPVPVREAANGVIRRDHILLCEPVRFEILRNAPRGERAGLNRRLATVPMLSTPASLWRDATALGQKCCDAGFTAGAYDLLIACLCAHHRRELVTFDSHFQTLSSIGGFEIEVIARPA